MFFTFCVIVCNVFEKGIMTGEGDTRGSNQMENTINNKDLLKMNFS
jgi:hypothetical protein